MCWEMNIREVKVLDVSSRATSGTRSRGTPILATLTVPNLRKGSLKHSFQYRGPSTPFALRAHAAQDDTFEKIARVAQDDTRGKVAQDDWRVSFISERSSCRLLVPVTTQILPHRVDLFDECNFLFAPPGFQLLLATDCGCYFAIGLVVQQSSDLMLGRKTLKRVLLVLCDAEGQVARNANVQSAAQTSEYVHRVETFASSSHNCRRSKGPSTQDDNRKGVCAVTGKRGVCDEKFSPCHPERSERGARTESKGCYKRRMMRVRGEASRQLASIGVPRLLAALVARDDTRGRVARDDTWGRVARDDR